MAGADFPPDSLEARIFTALKRIDAADLHPYDAQDIAKLFDRAVRQRQSVMTQLQGMVDVLNEIARLLRALPEVTDDAGEGEAREGIAVDFTAGARAIETARDSLRQATEHLKYLDYSML